MSRNSWTPCGAIRFISASSRKPFPGPAPSTPSTTSPRPSQHLNGPSSPCVRPTIATVGAAIHRPSRMRRSAERFSSPPASAADAFNAMAAGTSARAIRIRRQVRTADSGRRSGFFNTGVSSYAAPNRGLFEQTQRPEDIGKFRPPTLRNIALTAPYMHDGSLATLEEVIDHYAAGGKFDHPNKIAYPQTVPPDRN